MDCPRGVGAWTRNMDCWSWSFGAWIGGGVEGILVAQWSLVHVALEWQIFIEVREWTGDKQVVLWEAS